MLRLFVFHTLFFFIVEFYKKCGTLPKDEKCNPNHTLGE